MFQTTECIYEALLRKNIKSRIRETPELSAVEVSFTGKNCPTVMFLLVSHSDEGDVALRSNNLIKYPQDHQDRVYAKINELNFRFRFAKFVCNTERCVIDIQMDLPSCCANPADAAVELLLRGLSILDETYTELMQGIWG